jgi:chromate reductase, NAD(P)H dehydrogenase (quinone)
MPKTYRAAVIVGSLRKGSLNRAAALALAKLAPDNLKLEIVEIGDLPLYDEDVEAAGTPEPWARFREEVKASDAVLFVTPEYNRSVPGGLKNAIDVGSRPYGASVFSGKPAAVMSLSPGAIGGFGANHHLRQSLVFLDMPLLQQPEAYVGGAGSLFDDEGELTQESARALFASFIQRFAAWIERNSPAEENGDA